MKEYILTTNDGTVTLGQLKVNFPSKIFVFDEGFMKFCFELAKREQKFEGDLIRIYCNLLFLKSQKAKVLYRLYNLDRQGFLKEVHINFISRKKFAFLFSEEVFISKDDSNGNLLSHRIIPNLFFKYFANKLFYLLKAKIKQESIVKSWVEVSEKIYRKEIPDAQVLIYPFPIKIYRQLKYILTKIKKSEKFGFMGIPYQISPILKAFSTKNLDYHVTAFEYVGAIRHADYYIKNSKVKKIFTTEEFEAGSYAFSKKLVQNQIHITNTCHGLSVYSPFVSYSKFVLFNRKQQDLYSVFNGFMDFKLMHAGTQKKENIKASKFIFIDQGKLKNFGLHYEANLRERVLSILNKVGEKEGTRIHIKSHPNTKRGEIKRLQAKYRFLPIIKDLEQLDEDIVFITLYSTAYYDFGKLGSFLFIKDDLFDPTLFFGPEINTVHVSELKNRIEEIVKNG